jgi:hypothetical protein
MSRDQRPGKIRLVDGQAASAPQRRFDDKRAQAPEASAVDAAAEPEAAPASRGGSIVLTGLFLIGCAAGGALFTALIPIGSIAG